MASQVRCITIPRTPGLVPGVHWSQAVGEGRRHIRLREPLTCRAQWAPPTAAHAEVRADRNAAEVTITTADRRGLFADLAEVLSGLGANVAGARAYTTRGGRVLDVFYLQDHAGEAFGAESPRALERVARALEAAATGEAKPAARAGPVGPSLSSP